jgi:hypothetical protein
MHLTFLFPRVALGPGVAEVAEWVAGQVAEARMLEVAQAIYTEQVRSPHHRFQ